jgi:ubiquinone/menaquinone biosynthesis C-methylase UbiE
MAAIHGKPLILGTTRKLMKSQTRPDAHYLLGRTDREYERLIDQARWINPYTEKLFADVGIKAGMRVLDIGSGVGDVSLVLGKLVGSTGEIIGVDQDSLALARAKERTDKARITWVKFLHGDFRKLSLDGLFDAIVGRYVLMYQADPLAAIKSVTRHLSPIGVVAFQELDMSRIPICWPRVPLFEQCFRWARAANRKAKVHIDMGLNLYRTFLAANLTNVGLRLDTLVGAGPDFEGYRIIAESMRSILPILEKSSIATAEQVGADTLERRLRAAVVSTNALVTWSPIFGVWGRAPVPSKARAT